MLRIIKIGMDVHSKKYALCALEPKIGEEDCFLASTEVTADYKNILMFIDDLQVKLGYDNDYDMYAVMRPAVWVIPYITD